MYSLVESETIQVSSRTTNSRMSSARVSDQTLSRLTLTGTRTLLINDRCMLIHVFSDWVKLYLGKKNGTHVLGCQSSIMFSTRLSLPK